MELLVSHDSYVNLAFSPTFMVVNGGVDGGEVFMFNI